MVVRPSVCVVLIHAVRQNMFKRAVKEVIVWHLILAAKFLSFAVIPMPFVLFVIFQLSVMHYLI